MTKLYHPVREMEDNSKIIMKKIFITIIFLGALFLSNSQSLKKIIDAYDGIYREELIELIVEETQEDSYIILPININTPSFSGKICASTYELYHYYLEKENRLRSFVKADSCYICFLNQLLLLNDTLSITDWELENHFNKKRIIKNIFEDSVFVEKEQFLARYFNEYGTLLEDSFYLINELASLLSNWNFLITCGGCDYFDCRIINFSGECSNDLVDFIEKSFEMFMDHFDNPQEFIFDSYIPDLSPNYINDRYGIKSNYISKKDFKKKYIQMSTIHLCYDRLIIRYQIVSFSEGSSPNILRLIPHYSGLYKYKYNPKLRRYFFVEEEFIEE